jgi:hypothetical protein
MFTSVRKLALLGGAPLLTLVALATPSQAQRPATPQLKPLGGQHFQPNQPPTVLTNPNMIPSPAPPLVPPGRDSRSWWPYPLYPPNPWPYPPYPDYPPGPYTCPPWYTPGLFPNPYVPGSIGILR